MSYSQSVIDGDCLQSTCQYVENDPDFVLVGKDGIDRSCVVPVGEEMLSRHILMLGGSELEIQCDKLFRT